MKNIGEQAIRNQAFGKRVYEYTFFVPIFLDHLEGTDSESYSEKRGRVAECFVSAQKPVQKDTYLNRRGSDGKEEKKKGREGGRKRERGGKRERQFIFMQYQILQGHQFNNRQRDLPKLYLASRQT